MNPEDEHKIIIKTELDTFVTMLMHDVYLLHDSPCEELATYTCGTVGLMDNHTIKKINDAFDGAIVLNKGGRSVSYTGSHNDYTAMLLFLQVFDLRDVRFCQHNYTSYEIWIIQYFCKISKDDAEYIDYHMENTVISFTRDDVGKLLEAISKNKWCNVPKVMMSIGHSSNGSIQYKYAMKELIEAHWLLDHRTTGAKILQEWRPLRDSNVSNSDVVIACVDD